MMEQAIRNVDSKSLIPHCQKAMKRWNQTTLDKAQAQTADRFSKQHLVRIKQLVIFKVNIIPF